MLVAAVTAFCKEILEDSLLHLFSRPGLSHAHMHTYTHTHTHTHLSHHLGTKKCLIVLIFFSIYSRTDERYFSEDYSSDYVLFPPDCIYST